MVISIKQQGWELGKIEFKQKQITRFQVSNVITQKRNKELIQLIFEGNFLTIHPQYKDREKKKREKKDREMYKQISSSQYVFCW